jgi:hypothetical protein
LGTAKATSQEGVSSTDQCDLFWRHEAKNDLFKLLANKLNLTQKQFEKGIEAFE